ncbi:hypothetical protein CRM22_009356 [Opisthorchis felineus]|uniref:PDZ domain-containing protein n=1 Tax=Opisthorchis felineus TaxID=147828 RepID=A0A4S2L796_OPIFE|nr:hypothetical protein CRM22_009356 [Opisthorchis felineus]
MSALENNLHRVDGMLSSVRRSEMSGNTNIDSVGLDKKISRVLRLRDMFQTGIIRPIEEIDDPVTPPMPTSDKQISDERLRFLSNTHYSAHIFNSHVHQTSSTPLPSPVYYSILNHTPPFRCYSSDAPSENYQTLPGSPPLSTLRAHQANFAKTQTAGTKNLNKDPSLPNGTNPTAPSRPSPLASDPSPPLPPATPPKPSYLPLDIIPPVNRPTAFSKSKVSTELQKSIAIFESGNTSQPATQNGPAKPVRVTSKPPGKTNGALEARRNVFQPSARTDTLQTSAQPQQRRGLSSAQQESSVTISIPPRQSIPEINSHATVVPNRNGSSQPTLSLQIPPTGFPCGGSTPKSSPLSAGVSDSDQNETEYESVESYRPGLSSAGPGRLSSWQGTSELNRISPSVPGTESVQDFIVQSNAFRTSPNYMLEAAHLDHAMPTLQHAETIAVTTPDEDDDSDGVMERPTCPVPNLPVPASLKVVAVDPEGVHILEDGNFVYAVPGLPGYMDSYPAESDVVQLRSCKVPNHPNDAAGKHPQNSSPEDNGSLLPDSSHDSFNKRVRFSGDPILIFSTYSTSEYDRRNDEVDPLAASAEYELEKHLEEMDLFNVDLQKSAQGLGISILGLGVDNVGGEQKLGIFIKALTPGGAAEANGKIMVYDQIVEVDGISLVGVSQQFAAQTLRSTKDVVHFVLAREKDPANSRIAQLLAEQEQDEVERAPNPVERRYAGFQLSNQ